MAKSKMVTDQAILAAVAVAGFASGRPLARRVLGAFPGLPAGELGDNLVGAVAAIGAFLIAKRML
jgi:hypothetical protein